MSVDGIEMCTVYCVQSKLIVGGKDLGIVAKLITLDLNCTVWASRYGHGSGSRLFFTFSG